MAYKTQHGASFVTVLSGRERLMELTLLLNASYEPLRVVHWQKAITLLWQGKVEVLEVYDRDIRGSRFPSSSPQSCAY